MKRLALIIASAAIVAFAGSATADPQTCDAATEGDNIGEIINNAFGTPPSLGANLSTAVRGQNATAGTETPPDGKTPFNGRGDAILFTLGKCEHGNPNIPEPE